MYFAVIDTIVDPQRVGCVTRNTMIKVVRQRKNKFFEKKVEPTASLSFIAIS